jgi:hypothetical protein
MKLTKKDKIYIARKKRLRAKELAIEDVIMACIEDRSYKQAKDIVDIVLQSFPDVVPRNIMRIIYNIMHVSLAHLPTNYEDDLVLL